MDLRTGLILSTFILVGVVGLFLVSSTVPVTTATPTPTVTPPGPYDLGVKAVQDGNVIGAIRHFKEALKKRPGSDRAMLNLARCYFGAGNYNLAVDYYDQYSRLHPDNANIIESIGECQYRQAYNSTQPNPMFVTLARKFFKDALAIDPSLVKSGILLGHILRREKKFDLAEKQFLATAKLNPVSLQPQRALLKLYHDKGDKLKIEAQLKVLKKLDTSPKRRK